MRTIDHQQLNSYVKQCNSYNYERQTKTVSAKPLVRKKNFVCKVALNKC